MNRPWTWDDTLAELRRVELTEKRKARWHELSEAVRPIKNRCTIKEWGILCDYFKMEFLGE